jgi:hypothetical protein
MKVLLDENLPRALRHELVGHDVFTVSYMGWSSTKNGALLARAAQHGFQVFVTMDNGVAYQQNPATLQLSVVILSAASTQSTRNCGNLRKRPADSAHACFARRLASLCR